MNAHEDILKILENGESRHIEFKRRLTKSDLKKERREKLITRIKYLTCDNPFEGLFLIGIEDIAGKEWKIRGVSEAVLGADITYHNYHVCAASVKVFHQSLDHRLTGKPCLSKNGEGFRKIERQFSPKLLNTKFRSQFDDLVNQ